LSSNPSPNNNNNNKNKKKERIPIESKYGGPQPLDGGNFLFPSYNVALTTAKFYLQILKLWDLKWNTDINGKFHTNGKMEKML
jgi:hypothetical protein